MEMYCGYNQVTINLSRIQLWVDMLLDVCVYIYIYVSYVAYSATISASAASERESSGVLGRGNPSTM